MLDQYAKVNANYTTGSTNDITKSLVDAISYKAEDGYEVLSNSIKMYKYDSSNSKLLSVDGATTIVETWTNDKFTDGNETVYQLIKDGEGTVTQLKVGDKTYDLKDGYFITSNLSMVTSITEKGGNGYLKSYDTTSGEIKFDGVKVDDYFKTHIGANELTFICTITSAYGSYDFQVVITKTS